MMEKWWNKNNSKSGALSGEGGGGTGRNGKISWTGQERQIAVPCSGFFRSSPGRSVSVCWCWRGKIFLKQWTENFPRERNEINGCRKFLEMSERYFSGARKNFLYQKSRRLYRRSERYLNGTFFPETGKPVSRNFRDFTRVALAVSQISLMPVQTPASAPASPRPSSSSSWTFWPSK